MNQEHLQKIYTELVKSKLAGIKSLKKIERSDKNVSEVMEVLRTFYSKPLDTTPPHELLNIGGKLLGHYASLGITSAERRATRDAAGQAYDELYHGAIVEKVAGGTGVTESRAQAKGEFATINQELLTAEYNKNSYEAILEAVSKTIIFIQSAIKVKMPEQINTPRLNNQYD